MIHNRLRHGLSSNPERDLLIDGIARSIALELSLDRTTDQTNVPSLPYSVHPFTQLIRRERLTGFVLHHCESISLPPEVVEALRIGGSQPDEDSLEITTLSLQAWTLRISRMLSEASVDHLVFKGWPLSVMSAGEASLRGAGDVDVLIRFTDVPAVDQLLTRSGFQPLYSLGPRSRLGWRFICFRNREMPYRSDWAEVDIHWRVGTESDMLPTTETLLRRAVTVGSAGQEIRTLHPSDALAAAAFHFYLDYCQSLRRLIDFMRLGARADGEVLIDLPWPARQAIADLTCFCEELFGICLPRPPGIPDPLRKNVAAIWDLFGLSHASGCDSTRTGPASGGPLRRSYRHLSRYCASHTLIVRLIARGLVWFPRTVDHPQRIGLIRAFFWQLSRLLRGQTSSHI